MADLGTMRIGVINNPLSGGNRTGMGEIRKILAESPEAVHSDVRTPREAARALAEFARRDVDVVAINGGDGTVHAVLSVLFHRQPFERPPLLAVLRAGTTSMIAGDVGLRGPGAQALRRLLSWARGAGDAVIRPRPVLRVQAADREPLYGMFFGAGAIHQGIQYYHGKMHPLGLRREVGQGITLARFLLAAASGKSGYISPEPVAVGLDDGAPERRDFLLLLVTTLRRLVLGLRPYLDTGPGALHYTAVDARPRHLLRVVPFLFRGRESRHGTPENGYESRNVREARLELAGGFTLDGQLYTPEAGSGPLTVRDGGRATFLQL